MSKVETQRKPNDSAGLCDTVYSCHLVCSENKTNNVFGVCTNIRNGLVLFIFLYLRITVFETE